MRPVALVTGISGVLGSAVVPALAQSFEIVALTGRRPIDLPCRQVGIDLRAPRLGLDAAAFKALAQQADVIVHLAGNVRYTASAEDLHAVNEGGAAQMVALAEAAGSPLLYASTAFAARHTQAAREASVGAVCSSRPSAYHRSKAAADDRIRSCTQPWSIIRPSIVMGDSLDGAMPELQNMHQIMMFIAAGLPAIFARPDQRVDMVPRDHVAAAVNALARLAVEGSPLPGEYWATAGPAALTAAEWIDVLGASVTAAGLPFQRPALLDPFTTDLTDYPQWETTRRSVRRALGNLYVSALALGDGDAFPASTLPESLRVPEIDPAAARSLFANDMAWLLQKRIVPGPRHHEPATAASPAA
ncbi:SDR family oxidoreductase [Kitasatospora sp. NPDC092948]|uniref:SDR family oxidoreductase n=1 Tax=Kitasatospora sp. NPDC092948 TaxID=3364088 RepID=UPI003810F95D